jgi:hypothetical protein
MVDIVTQKDNFIHLLLILVVLADSLKNSFQRGNHPVNVAYYPNHWSTLSDGLGPNGCPENKF